MALCGSTTKLEAFLLIQTAVWPLSLQAATSVGGGVAVHNTMETVSTLRGHAEVKISGPASVKLSCCCFSVNMLLGVEEAVVCG